MTPEEINAQQIKAREAANAGLCSPAPAGSVCSECKWTNVSLVNLGYVGKPRWVCQGCCRSALEVVDAVRKALTTPNTTGHLRPDSWSDVPHHPLVGGTMEDK